MNSKRIKSIKTLCSLLPVVDKVVEVRKVTKGSEVPMTLRNKSDIEVDPNGLYSIKSKEVQKIDWYKGIKKAYGQGKEQGVIDYLKEVREIYFIQCAKYSAKEDKEKWEGIDKIIAGGAKSFWKTILAFILAFLGSFMVSEKKD